MYLSWEEHQRAAKNSKAERETFLAEQTHEEPDTIRGSLSEGEEAIKGLRRYPSLAPSTTGHFSCGTHSASNGQRGEAEA